MSQAQDTSKLITYLDSLKSALDEGDRADILAFLRVLRMNGLDDETSAQLVAAFSEEPQPAHYQQVRQWVDDQRAELQSSETAESVASELDDFDPFEGGDFVSVADEVSEFEDLDDADGLDAFVSVADEEPALQDLQLDDESSEAHAEPQATENTPAPQTAESAESFPPSEEFEVDDVFDDLDDDPAPATPAPFEVDSTGSQTDQAPDEKSTAPDSAESLPPSDDAHSDELFTAGATPPPGDASTSSPTVEHVESPSSPSLEDDFESDAAHSPAAASSNITGEREKTRQLDNNHLQALSHAASTAQDSQEESETAAKSGAPTTEYESPDNEHDDFDFALGSSISTPLEDYGIDAPDSESSDEATEDEDVHQRPTRRQFQADVDSLSSGAVADDPPATEENRQTNDSGTPSDDAPDDDFDIAPDSEPATAEQPDDEFDFDLAPDSEPATAEQPDDEFDFDLAPEQPADEPDDTADDEFDFDLAPDSEPATAEQPDDEFDFDIAPEQPADEPDDDLDFDLAPESSSSQPDDNASVDEDMGYASPPDDDSFFPPPLSEGDSEDTGASPQGRTPKPTPIPESPSGAEPMPSNQEPGPAPSDPSEPTGGISHGDRPRQPTPMVQQADVDKLQQGQKTPAAGVTPLPPSADDEPLPEDELIALGEELSASSTASNSPSQGSEPNPPPSSQPAPTKGSEPLPPPENEGDSGARPNYRGEPVIREMGDEPTPDNEPPTETPTGRFSAAEHQPEETNPFAQEAETGVQNEPVGVVDRSSFILEEVEPSAADLEDPQAAIETALDQAQVLYEEGEFDDALDLVDDVLEVDEESERALDLKGTLEGELERVKANRLGSLSNVPTLSISMGEIPNLDLDHRAGFLLSQIDGMLTFEDILDMSTMSRLETLTLLADLYEQEIISVD